MTGTGRNLKKMGWLNNNAGKKTFGTTGLAPNPQKGKNKEAKGKLWAKRAVAEKDCGPNARESTLWRGTLTKGKATDRERTAW